MQMQMQMLSSNVHKCTRKLNKIRECNISFFFLEGGGGGGHFVCIYADIILLDEH